MSSPALSKGLFPLCIGVERYLRCLNLICVRVHVAGAIDRGMVSTRGHNDGAPGLMHQHPHTEHSVISMHVVLSDFTEYSQSSRESSIIAGHARGHRHAVLVSVSFEI